MADLLKRLRRPRYCGMCGQRFVEKTWRDGFDRGTGAPRMRTFEGCPNGRARPEWETANECYGTVPLDRD